MVYVWGGESDDVTEMPNVSERERLFEVLLIYNKEKIF